MYWAMDGSKTQKVKLNNKTEAICFLSSSSVNTTMQYPQSLSALPMLIEFAGIVRNLGFICDSDLWMKQPIIKPCKAAYMEIRRTGPIRQYFTEDTTKTVG